MRASCRWLCQMLCLTLSAGVIPTAVAAQAPAPLSERIQEMRRLVDGDARDQDRGAAFGLQLRDDALAAGDTDTASMALRLVGTLRLNQERLAEAQQLLDQAADVARRHGHRQRELEALLVACRVRALSGDADRASTDAYTLLAEILEAPDLPREYRLWAYNQAMPAARIDDRYRSLITSAVALLAPDDRGPGACSLWHAHGDFLFGDANYVAAHEALTQALTCYQARNSRGEAGRVLVSLGRVQRAHGQLRAALDFYERAATMQEADRDMPAFIQSLNAQAVTWDRLGRFAAGERLYRRALALAREHKLERHEVFLLGNLGGALLSAGKVPEALRELQAALTREKTPYLRAVRFRQIADAQRELGQFSQALDALEGARAAVPSPSFDDRVSWLTTHALILAGMGELDRAQADVDESIRLIEDARSRVLPGDTARRGFGDLHQGAFSIAIDLAARRDAHQTALELAEQARARALLDLLHDQRADQSRATAPARLADMQALARSLDTTLLVYWVGDRTTLAWIVGAESLSAHRLPVGSRTLRQLVSVAAGSGNVPGAINAALIGGADLQAWRSLYRALVAPIERDLPTGAAARLTIVPHGPLLHLPFAGLLDRRGRHLVERYVLTYAPSVAVLAAARDRTPSASVGRALVIGDPAPLPRLAGVQLPPPLPLAREEARRVARRFSQGGLLSIGGAATEGTLRAELQAFGWLHVATHAVVAEEATAPSYLLLARGHGGAADDGLLTADEVKDLPLSGATVVLSACGTALGRITGEGTLGFTRSFLAAGARAVVATTWSMPDTAGLRLMDAFYAARSAGAGLGEALRTAQLQQLRALRAGKVTATAGSTRLALPATPLLWAGYILVGAP